jgi:hypothetical protein
MRYSIITPTLCRESLLRACESVDIQTDGDFEHLIAIDVPLLIDKRARDVIARVKKDPRRKLIRCGKQHRNFGNSCRHNLQAQAQGDYLLYLDDDNFWADANVLKTLNEVTEQWAIFTMLRVGVERLDIPPGFGKTDAGQIIHRRGLTRWPDNNKYAADGEMIDDLISKAPYQVLHTRPLLIYEQRSQGK